MNGLEAVKELTSLTRRVEALERLHSGHVRGDDLYGYRILREVIDDMIIRKKHIENELSHVSLTNYE